MSNDYFDHRASVDRLVRRTVAQADDVNDLFDAVSEGFDKVELKDLAALRVPDGETPGTVPAAASRAGKSLAFDSSGDPVAVIAANTAEMLAAVDAAAEALVSAAAADASADEAAATAATITSAMNALVLMQIQSGII